MIDVLLLFSTEGEEDDGKGIHLECRVRLDAYSLLQAPVEPFNHPIGLRRVCCRTLAAGPQKCQQVTSSTGFELHALVRNDGHRCTELCHPDRQEVSRRAFCSDVWHGNSGSPADHSINIVEQVTVTEGGRQRTHQIHVHGVEALSGRKE